MTNMKTTAVKVFGENTRNQIENVWTYVLSVYKELKSKNEQPIIVFDDMLASDQFFRHFIDFINTNREHINLYDERPLDFVQKMEYAYNQIKKDLRMSDVQIFRRLIKSILSVQTAKLEDYADRYINMFLGVGFVMVGDVDDIGVERKWHVRYSRLDKKDVFKILLDPTTRKHIVPPPKYKTKYFFDAIYNKFAVQISYFMTFTTIATECIRGNLFLDAATIKIDSNQDIKLIWSNKKCATLSTLDKISDDLSWEYILKNAI